MDNMNMDNLNGDIDFSPDTSPSSGSELKDSLLFKVEDKDTYYLLLPHIFLFLSNHLNLCLD